MKKQKKTKASTAKKSKRESTGRIKRGRAVKVNNTAGLTIADAFAGVGAFRLAFQAIGVACAWACEIDRFAARVYRANFDDDPTGDITAVNARDMPDHDILCAGFPCQSHSLQGKRRGMDDPRGRLIYHLVRILLAKRPRAFVFENVENFQHIDGGRPFADLKAQLERLGYEVHHAVLDARNFGVAQSRRRLFLVGILRSAGAKAFRFPEGGSPETNLQDIIEPDGDVPERFDFSETYRNALLRAKDMNRAKGSNHGFIFAKRTHFNALMSRESGTEKNAIIRPNGTWRRPTPLEYKRAQGFPASYDLSSVSVGRRYNLMGNSVAVPVVKAIAERLVAALTGESESGAGPIRRRSPKNGSDKRRSETTDAAITPVRRRQSCGNGGTPPSPLVYYGGKSRLAPTIVPLFPPHRTYVEPFCGGGSVFFAKPPSPVEVINDLHGDLVNFFRVLRNKNQCEQLIALHDFTPWSRREFGDCVEALNAGRWENAVERAWMYLVSIRQGRGGISLRASNWSFSKTKSAGGMSGWTRTWMQLPERMAVAGLRLRTAQIECMPWQYVLDKYESADTLVYADPPYVHATRKSGNKDAYHHEMTEADHARLLLRLKQYKGNVVLILQR